MSNINNQWSFGHRAGLDFSSSPPLAITTSIGTVGSTNAVYEGCASIADSNGDLLMYTDGINIWNGAHTLISSSLRGDFSSTQSAIIVPNPGNPSEYYIFTMDGSTGGAASGQVNQFNGALINVSAPTWSITPLSSVANLPSTTGLSPCEKITAVQSANCKDYWLIMVLQKGTIGSYSGDGVFRVFKVDSSGVNHEYDRDMNTKIPEAGYLKVAPDGKHLAMANSQIDEVLIYDFNNSSGDISVGSLERIKSPEAKPYGLEFSPDGSLLYFAPIGARYNASASDTSTSDIYQVDLSASPLVANSVGTITNVGGGGVVGALQLGPDGKIYICQDRRAELGVILNPNVIGNGCQVLDKYVTLNKGTVARYGLPNLIANPCSDSGNDDCGCGCEGCNEDHESLNDELIERAKTKFNTIRAIDSDCGAPFMDVCSVNAVTADTNFKPCFYFHWGDGKNDQIEEHDTEVFYLTVCNSFNDVKYRGLKITSVSLIPGDHPIEKIHIVPDRFISIDCLEPCSCEVREFAMINRATDTAGKYKLHVEYCFDEVVLTSQSNTAGSVDFPLEITED